jgi:hypothetical protein
VCLCRKDIGPLQWDLSVAEHLKPGEAYVEVCLSPLSNVLYCQVGTIHSPVLYHRVHQPGAEAFWLTSSDIRVDKAKHTKDNNNTCSQSRD